MRIELDKGQCKGCKKPCLDHCPNQLQKLNAFNCRHCKPQTAACAAACPEKAFYQIAEGILAIDPDLCNGCGKCIDACPEKAIEMVKGKAVKCDCCAGNNFSMACIKACAQGALSLEKNRMEIKQVENLLGWRVHSLPAEEISKTLKKKNDFEIVQLRNREKYFLLKLPEFSLQEARLLHNALGKFKSSPTGKKKVTAEILENFLKEFCFFHQLELDAEQKNYLLKTLNSLVFGFGPVSSLLEKENLEEIALIGLGREKPLHVFDKNFGWLKTNLYFCSEQTVQDLVNKMARSLGRRLSLQTPKLNAVLNDGNRLNAVISPVAFTGPTFTIRKFRSKPFTPAELLSKNTFSAPALALLWLSMQTDASLLLAGNTGSGKTTSLNALFNFVPSSERIIVTEETPELSLPHCHLIKLSETKELGASLNELIADTLRMRPDRVIVGEMRTAEEVSAFFDTLLAGQGKGSYATFHALSANEALKRLKRLGVMELDLGALDLIIIQKRWNKINLKKNRRFEARHVMEVTEVLEEKNGVRLNPLFEFDFKKNKLKKRNASLKVREKIKRTFNFSDSQLKKELKKREKFLVKAAAQKMPAQEFFRKAQEEF